MRKGIDKEADMTEHLLRDMLYDWTEESAPDVLPRVLSTLDKSAPAPVPVPVSRISRRRSALRWAACAAALLLCATTLLHLSVRRTDSPQETADVTALAATPAVQSPALPSGESSPAATDGAAGTVSEKIRTVIGSAGLSGLTDVLLAQAEPMASAESLPVTAQLTSDETSEAPSVVSDLVRNVIQEPAARSYSNAGGFASYADILWGLPENDLSRGGVSAGLYAGNFGSGGTYSTNGIAHIAASDMAITDRPFAVTSASGAHAVRAAAPAEPTMHHHMPFEVGLRISVPMWDRWSLITGLSYSYLHSTSSVTEFSDYQLVRSLHYLGIPVGVSYNILERGRLSVYAQGAFMLERALYGSQSRRINGRSVDSEHLSIAGFQPSVSAAFGVGYGISPRMGLYFEPGVSYFFETNSQPASYRTEHPTNLSLRMGLRMTLGR